ncbi:hypothetical protein [Pseudomonas matsuisoli]|nr:hypothetical protein [Pseudomonas matsuisoli]
MLPIEFARESDGGELATVLCDDTPEVPVLWAYLDTRNLEDAREYLRIREAIPDFQPECVGSIPSQRALSAHAPTITDWARNRTVDAVIWTNLPPRSQGKNHRKPNESEVIEYLTGLPLSKKEHAEHYIRSTPKGIATPYRRLVEEELGWCHL